MKLQDRKIEQVFDYDEVDSNKLRELDEKHVQMLIKSINRAQHSADEIIKNQEIDLTRAANAYKSTIEHILSLIHI